MDKCLGRSIEHGKWRLTKAWLNPTLDLPSDAISFFLEKAIVQIDVSTDDLVMNDRWIWKQDSAKTDVPIEARYISSNENAGFCSFRSAIKESSAECH